MNLIATFHTHFGAVNFTRIIKKMGQDSVMMPVPRVLSASCGVCVKFQNDDELDYSQCIDLDCIYEQNDNDYKLKYQAE